MINARKSAEKYDRQRRTFLSLSPETVSDIQPSHTQYIRQASATSRMQEQVSGA